MCVCLHVRCFHRQYLTGRVITAGHAMSSEEQQRVFGLSPVRPQPPLPRAATASNGAHTRDHFDLGAWI